jgi:hypothetical protein
MSFPNCRRTVGAPRRDRRCSLTACSGRLDFPAPAPIRQPLFGHEADLSATIIRNCRRKIKVYAIQAPDKTSVVVCAAHLELCADHTAENVGTRYVFATRPQHDTWPYYKT